LFIKRKKTTFALELNNSTIKKVSYVVRFVVGIVLGFYLALLLFTASPACQRWLAAKVSDVATRELQTKVEIGRARIGLFNRVVIDDILVMDQQSDTLLAAARLSAKMDVWQLMQGYVRIANIQLFGYDARLRRRQPDEPYNFQFIIDRFASQDTTSTPLDLAIKSIIIRRGTLSHDLDYEPASNRFTPAHVRLKDLGIRASINALTNGSISASISQLSFTEENSGFALNNLSATFEATQRRAFLSDAVITLPQSELNIPSLTIDEPLASLERTDALAYVNGRVTPSDLSCFLPQLATFNKPLHLESELSKTGKRIDIPRLLLHAEGLALNANAAAHLQLEDSTRALPLDDVRLDIERFYVSKDFYHPILLCINSEWPSTLSSETLGKLTQLGDIDIQGKAEGKMQPRQATADLQVKTALGQALAKGQMNEKEHFNLHLETKDLKIASLSDDPSDLPVDHVNILADVEGNLKQRIAKGSLALTDILIKGSRIDHILSDFALKTNQLRTSIEVADDEYSLRFSADLHDIDSLRPSLNTLEHIQGDIVLEDVEIRSAEHNYDLHQLKFTTNNDSLGHHLVMKGDFINARADGRFRYTHLVPTIQQFLHRVLPSLIPAASSSSLASTDQVQFSLHAWNVNPIFNLFNLDIQMPEAAYVDGNLDGSSQTMSLKVDLPRIIYASEDLRAVSLTAQQEGDSISSVITMQRMMEEGPMSFTVSAAGGNDLLSSTIGWDNQLLPSHRGELNALTHFFRNEENKLGAEIDIKQGQLVISDTTWNVQASKLMLHDDVVDVHGFEVSQLGRHLHVNGRVSKNPADTLYADLQGINLQYIFGIIDFHDVEMAGLATGKVKIHDIFTSVAVDADMRVDNFTLNDGLLGTVYVTGGFGRKDDRAIDIDAYVHEPLRHEISHVVGLIKPGHEEGRGMQLDIQARYLNTYFINSFTEGIFTDLQGRATGHAYLHGPFKRLDLEGELAVDTLYTTIDVLGTHYHLLGGDSLHLYPGGIRFTNVKVYDRYHQPGMNSHYADLDGELRFEHFQNIHFDFNILAHNILGYDFRDFGDQSFYGTVFADGTVRLSGRPGALDIDLHCRPTSGTVFTYNVSTPETMTDNEFITFVSQNQAEALKATARKSENSGSSNEEEEVEDDEPTDIHINFDLDITPDAQMRLLMDPRSEDYITLFGNGHIRANFFNKGRFQMYGTYRVDHGTYRLSLQDVIHKEFRFHPGGTIVFGGQPLKAALDLQAVYTVPSVSLNDLATGSNFSNASVRVNCLMNIGGQAEHPQITFDFDIPNVNEDEKQMVRSLISTEEERNLQVIYLLGIGRFYTYGLADQETQANSAVQSLLSSTLSGQLNDLLSSVVGNGNWNVGTNLSTGTQGWSNVDVEGSLSGRLLNNRLLINGTFGYRDTPISDTNFIGDFDVQWLLTPSGNLSLKAYSETNDRYFTKSALTTQGIGIKVKKDFNTLRELFLPKKK